MNSLTPRQVELISLLSQGYTSKETCQIMGISESTAKVHVARIKERLAARTRDQMMVIAITKGIVKVDGVK